MLILLSSFFPLQADGEVFVAVENLPEFIHHQSQLLYHFVGSWVLPEFYGLNHHLVELFSQTMRCLNLDIRISHAKHIGQQLCVDFLQYALESFDFPSPVIARELLSVN